MTGLDAMIGVFINTLPIRVSMDWQLLLSDWMQKLQQNLMEVRNFETSPLVRVQAWSDMPKGEALFQSVMAFENYPMESSLLTTNKDWHCESARFIEKTNYPLTLIVSPSEELSMKAIYDADLFDKGMITRLLSHYQFLLESMVRAGYNIK